MTKKRDGKRTFEALFPVVTVLVEAVEAVDAVEAVEADDAELDEADAELDEADADAELDEADAELDDADAELDEAEAELDEADAEVDGAAVALADTEKLHPVVCPSDGSRQKIPTYHLPASTRSKAERPNVHESPDSKSSWQAVSSQS